MKLCSAVPAGRTTLLKGGAGTGKTVLAMEFLYRSAQQGEPAMFISFEERAPALRRNAQAMGWDLAALEEAGKFFLWEAQVDQAAVVGGDFTIESLLAIIKGKAGQMGARRLVIDAVDVLLRLFEDPARQRNQLYSLHKWLVEQQFTTVLTAKLVGDAALACPYELLEYMVDCILHLDLRTCDQVATRRLRVVKYRGSSFCSNEYPYLIGEEGNVVMPITTVQLAHQPLGEKVSSGETGLDQCLGGGYHQSSAVLLAGPPGGGKTTLAANFACVACRHGRKVLYVSFEGSEASIVSAMLSPAIDLRPAVEAGRLHFHTIMPEALVPEAQLDLIFRTMQRLQPEHIVVDAISACQRMATETAADDFMMRLVNHCKRYDITCLMTNQTSFKQEPAEVSGFGLFSIIDTMVAIRIEEIEGQRQRSLVVLKSRGTGHSNRYHPYVISDRGIRIETVD